MTEPKYLRVTLDFYRMTSGNSARSLADIPADQLAFISTMGFIDMARPLAVWMLRDGVPLKKVAYLYGVHVKVLHRWKHRYL